VHDPAAQRRAGDSRTRYGPDVCLGPDALELPGFLALAEKLGGGMLYLRAVPFNPGSDDDQPADPPTHLVRHKGETGQVSVAFAANGLVHFWEQYAAWYLEWQELTDSDPSWGGAGMDEPNRLSDEECARLASELAAPVLADLEFRAAPRGEQNRLARNAIPPGTDSRVFWEAVREACERAQEMAKARYDQITPDRLGELAGEFVASTAYQQASSPAGRKKAAEQFLIAHADGFRPPAHVRDDLYMLAQRLARTAKGSRMF
jgi:hypothetical protein